MTKMLYPKLALQNIRKNKNTFVPFALASTIMIAMFYMLYAIKMQANDNLFKGALTMRIVLGFGLYVVGILAVIVLFYTDRFLIKQRVKEFGLYSLLGMEKFHIAKVVLFELLIIGGASMIAGLGAGMLFSRLLFMLLLNIIQVQTDFTFRIDVNAIVATVALFAITFAVIIIANSIRVFRLKPIELMQSGHTGEREPKAKWLLAVLGFGFLGTGYYLALHADNPLQAMFHFFIAVLCVMAGTYLLFLAGSIAILKIMKNNKKMYYHKKRFITISGMMYRMKQNAVGLANICILCTAVLVLLSSTVSLYVGIEDVLRKTFPDDVNLEFHNMENNPFDDDAEFLTEKSYDYPAVVDALLTRAEACDVEMKNIRSYDMLGFFGIWDDDTFSARDYVSTKTSYVKIITAADYNLLTGDSVKLNDGEALICSSKDDIHSDKIVVEDVPFTIVGTCNNVEAQDSAYIAVANMVSIVVNDLTVLQTICNHMQEKTDALQHITHYIAYDLSGSEAAKEKYVDGLRDYICQTGIAHLATVDDIITIRPEFFGLYGGMFFIGIFLGILFLVITVMIIYYKQLSEGYDDRERFQIMQKVGMSKQEVKKVIHSQILQVFFLPIALAIVHICFAFKIIKDILAIMEFTNAALYIGCTVGTALVFFLVYFIVYVLTARTYYRITSSKA